MNPEPLISVVVTNYNFEAFVGEAIESALAQTYRRTEVIVVDDGSRDASREVIARFGDRVKTVFKENGGECSSINAGFEVSHGEYVAFLDGDDALAPTAIADAAAIFSTDRLAKVHWPLGVVDLHGADLGRTTPDGALAAGDLRGHVIAHGPDSYPCSPTSGNCWPRWYLEKMLPIPTRDFPSGNDSYLELLAPFFGQLGRVEEPRGFYRIHGANSSGQLLFADQVRMFDARCKRLVDFLRDEGIACDPDRWRTGNYAYKKRLAAIGERLAKLIPPGARFVLADNQQWGQGRLMPGRESVPLMSRDGQDWGAPPDDAAALAALARRRDQGAQFLVFAAPALWWLDHYAGFRAHLDQHGTRISEDEDFVVYGIDAA